MGVQVQGNSGIVQEVAGTVFRAAHVHAKPLEYAALGHYRTSVRIVATAAQAANSRIFEIRNTHATNLIIPTRLTLRAMQIAAGTAQENSLDVYKATGFTVVDTTNTVIPTTSVKRTATMAAYPGGAAVRHLTLAGNAAGMTGGTITLDANILGTIPFWVNTAVPTAPAPNPIYGPYDALDDVNGTHPLALVQNEGLVVVNRVLNVTSYGMVWYIDFSWAEVAAY
jgi:hypothetical protein